MSKKLSALIAAVGLDASGIASLPTPVLYLIGVYIVSQAAVDMALALKGAKRK